MPRLALALAAAALLLAGCGGGPRTSTGRVTDVADRLCLQTGTDDGICFGATAEQLAMVALGGCAEVTYTASAGTVPEAVQVRRVDPPCADG